MKIIGLTGPSGAGKGMCGSIFSEYAIPVIDTDAVYHSLLEPPSDCADELIARFGGQIATPQGGIDRTALAALVFSDSSKKSHADLNHIAHHHVLKKTLALLDEYHTQPIRAVVIDAPLLFEADFDRFCDFTVAVLADRETRLKRIIERDGIDAERALARLNAQPRDSFYQDRADHILHNNVSCNTLREGLIAILKKEAIL